MKYWVLGEFPSTEEVKSALVRLKQESLGELDAYTPHPLEGMAELLELKPSPLRWIALLAGLFGAGGAYVVQWWANAANWPLNVGGRPPHSAPSFVPISFETMELFAAFSIFFGLLFLLKLPQVYHPVFELDSFKSASEAGYWVSVTVEAKSDTGKVAAVLQELHALQVSIVPEESP